MCQLPQMFSLLAEVLSSFVQFELAEFAHVGHAQSGQHTAGDLADTSQRPDRQGIKKYLNPAQLDDDQPVRILQVAGNRLETTLGRTAGNGPVEPFTVRSTPLP